ncbi:hypothetical protein [Streptomyces hydrogenans]|uniref:hypothetical protein n=1 Tax=Streptomyces hydrogenans TaxID=1873719 RepID=UPI0035D881EF
MWDYSALSEEARKLGGPDGLREFYKQLGVRIGEQKAVRIAEVRGFACCALLLGVSAAGWKAIKIYRDRAEAAPQAATPEAAAVTAETAPAAEEAVLAEAEADLATAQAPTVVGEHEQEPGAAPSPPASAQSAAAAGEDVSA